MGIEYKGRFQVSGRVVEIGDVKTFASGFTKREVVIETSQNEKYSSPVQVTFKKDDCERVATLGVGDGVQIEGFVEGRMWAKDDGTVKYFIDLAAKSVMLTGKAEKPTTAKSWKELVALGEAYGESEDKVKERAKALGKAFKEMTEDDWQALAAKIVEGNGGSQGEVPADDEDIPF